MPCCLEEGVLHQVGTVGLALQAPSDLQPGQQHQVSTVALEQVSQRLVVPRPGTGKQLLAVLHVDRSHLHSLHRPATSAIIAVQLSCSPHEKTMRDSLPM